MIVAVALILTAPVASGDDYSDYPHSPVERSLDRAHEALIDAGGYLCSGGEQARRQLADLDRRFAALEAEARYRLGRSLYGNIRTRACERYRSGRVARALDRARWWLSQAGRQLGGLPTTP